MSYSINNNMGMLLSFELNTLFVCKVIEKLSVLKNVPNLRLIIF